MKVSFATVAILLFVCALISETVEAVRKSNLKSSVNYTVMNETVHQMYKKHQVKKLKPNDKPVTESEKNDVTEPTIPDEKIVTLALPPLEGYEEPIGVGKDNTDEEDLEIADDYVPFYEDDYSVPGDMHDDIIEKSFGFGHGGKKVIRLTRIHELDEENPKPLKIVIIPPKLPREEHEVVVTEGDADFKVLRRPTVIPETVTQPSSVYQNQENEVYKEQADDMRKSHSKMLSDDRPMSYRNKKDYIVQQRIHKSDDKDIQARKEFALLQLIRNRNYKITQAKPVYRETVFMENVRKPAQKVSNIILTGKDDGDLELYTGHENSGLFRKYEEPEEKSAHVVITGKEDGEIDLYKDDGGGDLKELTTSDRSMDTLYYPEEEKSYGRSSRITLIHPDNSRRMKTVEPRKTEQIYLPNQLSPRKTRITSRLLRSRQKYHRKSDFKGKRGLELKTTYCDELPNGNYPNPGLVSDVDTRCSYITCSNKHTYLFHCPQGSWNGEGPGTYHGGEASSSIMTWKRGQVIYVGPSNSNVFCHVNSKKAIDICNKPVPANH